MAESSKEPGARSGGSGARGGGEGAGVEEQEPGVEEPGVEDVRWHSTAETPYGRIGKVGSSLFFTSNLSMEILL